MKQGLLIYPFQSLLEQKLSTSIITEVRKTLGRPEALIKEKPLCQYFLKYYREKGLLKSSQNSQQGEIHKLKFL